MSKKSKVPASGKLKGDYSFEMTKPALKGFKCSHCRFFRPLTEKTGRCIWPEVPADMDVSKCAGQIFRPR